jgi:hypothetical protein
MLIANYCNQTGVLFSKVTGKVTLETIFEHEKIVESYQQSNKCLKNIINCSDCMFDIDPQELSVTFESIEMLSKSFDCLNQAIVMSEPTGSALALMYESMCLNIPNYKFKLFSTEAAALQWLKEVK